MRRTLLICLLVIMACSTQFAVLSGQTLEPSKSSGSPLYLIRPNDVLVVFVWKDAALSGKFIVRPDGRISVPLVKDIQAAGLNPAQLSEKIEQGLKEYMDAPNVTVIVEESRAIVCS